MRNKPIPAHSPQKLNLTSRWFALGLVILSVPLASCGKIGPPTPPVRLGLRTGQLDAVQRGSTVVLTWPSPPLAGKQDSVQFVDGAYIYRLTERRDQEPVLDPDDYQDAAQTLGTIDRKTIVEQARVLGRLEFIDKLNITGPAEIANVRLRYAIKYFNQRLQEGPFSNTVAIEPRAGIANPPTDVQATDEAQDKVLIQWKAPESDIDGAKPADVVGYNVYRRTARNLKTLTLLNPRPVVGTTFTDTKFRYLTKYVYIVRALSTGDRGLIESADAAGNPFRPVDTYAPSAPTPVSIASVNGIISLFWPTNPESDVVGYNVYRAESDSSSAEWVKLTPKPITLVTFRDDKVKLGERYYYRVTAVDQFDNESKPSTTVSQVANP